VTGPDGDPQRGEYLSFRMKGFLQNERRNAGLVTRPRV